MGEAMARRRTFTRIRVYDDGTVTGDRPYAWLFWLVVTVGVLKFIGLAVIPLAKLAGVLIALYVGFRVIGAVYRAIIR